MPVNDPASLLFVTALGLGYGFMLHSLALQGKGNVVRWPRRLAFALGIIAVAAALLSPIERLAHDLLWAHMTQHMLLIGVAAPLLAYGAAPLRLAGALPLSARRFLTRLRGRLGAGAERAAAIAALAVAVHAAVVWIWHVPALYELALSSALVHQLEHIAFLGTAIIAWSALLAFGGRVRSSAAITIVLIALAAQGAALGAAMAFSPRPWYSSYAVGTPGAIDPLLDQQVAGLIMWGVGSVAPVTVATLLVAAWIGWSKRSGTTTRPIRG